MKACSTFRERGVLTFIHLPWLKIRVPLNNNLSKCRARKECRAHVPHAVHMQRKILYLNPSFGPF